MQFKDAMNKFMTAALSVSMVLISQNSMADASKPTVTKHRIGSSGETRVQLLELYSSESCSSCPPADQWVSSLRDDPKLWKKFVPVVFHVDYWNKLGWKDELSSEPMTRRQIELSNLWKNPSVYTPGMIVDGREWTDWRKSIHHELPTPTSSRGISLQITQEVDASITVKVSGQKSSQRYVVRIAELGLGINSKITAGENSGKELKHDFVVLGWDSKSIDGKTSEKNFTLPKSKSKTSRLAVAAWIEEEGNPTPLQAVGGYL
jgi:hypothetical protein